MTDQSAEMKSMMKMMASMKAEIDTLKSTETIVSVEEISKREIQHNKVLRDLIEHRKEKLRVGFGYGESEDAIHLDDNDRRNETYRDVMLQVMWSIAGGAKRQYMYNRYRTDQVYLWLNDILEKDGGSIGGHSNGIIGTGEDLITGIDNPNKEYLKAEANMQYHSSSMNTYEVLTIAAKELWQDAQEEKEEAWIEMNINNPDSIPPKVRYPDWDISDAAYVKYIETRVGTQQQEELKKGQRAMEASRLLRLTNRCDLTEEHVHD
jgi:hypothetical protein